MPFFGSDWRAPGDQWVRTELGWKRLADIRTTFQRQLGRVAAAAGVIASVNVKRSATSTAGGSRVRSRCGSSRSSTRSSSRASSRTSSPSPLKEKESCDEDRRLKLLQLALAQKCVSARKSSRESNHYATISDAFSKLNFNQALLDANCYPFICQVVEILFEGYYWTLSGSMQTSLLRLTESAKDIALQSRQHTGCVLMLIDREITTLGKGRSKMVTSFSISRLDSKIKSLLSHRTQLTSEFQRDFGGDETVPQLPNDCWRYILSFLVDPQDFLNLGSVNRRLHSLVYEDSVWNNLVTYHYGESYHSIKTGEVGGAVDHFKEIYKSSGRQLRVSPSHAAVLCLTCHCVYWSDYGHPCTLSVRRPVQTTTQQKKIHCELLTARQFVELYH